MTTTPGPFYFIVVFWGKEHREYFLRFLVPSLLSTGNLPSLPPALPHRFLIATTSLDWAAIQDEPAYRALSRLVEPMFLEIAQPAAEANKYLVMSGGYKVASERAFADMACGVFLTPDLVLSDGSVAALQRLALQGNNVVLSVAMRFTSEGCLPEIEALRGTDSETSLRLEPRTLAAIALRNMHPETLRYDWDAPCFAERPYSCFWRVPAESGIVVHSFSWAPLLVNYTALSQHKTDTFDRWTPDGDYIFRNFSLDGHVHVVRDSDEICLVSFTGLNELPGHLPPDLLAPRWYNRWPFIRHYWKIHCLRSLKNSGSTDPLKRRIFSMSVRMHTGGANSAAWERTEGCAAAVVGATYTSPSLLETICAYVVRFVRIRVPWPLSMSYRVKTIAAPPSAVNAEYANQSGVGSYRIWLTGPAVSKGRWYWELSSPNLGVAADTATTGIVTPQHLLVRELGSSRHGWGWRGDCHLIHKGRKTPYGPAADAVDQIVMVALDMDIGRVWFGRNGCWFNGGAPGTGAQAAFQGIKRTVIPAFSSRHGGRGTAAMHVHVTPDTWAYEPPAGFLPLTQAGGRQQGQG